MDGDEIRLLILGINCGQWTAKGLMPTLLFVDLALMGSVSSESSDKEKEFATWMCVEEGQLGEICMGLVILLPLSKGLNRGSGLARMG